MGHRWAWLGIVGLRAFLGIVECKASLRRLDFHDDFDRASLRRHDLRLGDPLGWGIGESCVSDES